MKTKDLPKQKLSGEQTAFSFRGRLRGDRPALSLASKIKVQRSSPSTPRRGSAKRELVAGQTPRKAAQLSTAIRRHFFGFPYARPPR
jgi:hypothetical protein